MTQTTGTATCVGSYGHSVHMAQEGYISHDQWPADICVPTFGSAENVGYDYSGNEQQDLQMINNEMMNEQHDRAYCQVYDNHACNIINPAYTSVGIGVYNSNGTTWLTEDFIQ
jgi:uncharacterized protein YkwD